MLEIYFGIKVIGLIISLGMVGLLVGFYLYLHFKKESRCKN